MNRLLSLWEHAVVSDRFYIILVDYGNFSHASFYCNCKNKHLDSVLDEAPAGFARGVGRASDSR